VPLTLTTRDGDLRPAIGSVQVEEIDGHRYFISMIQDAGALRAAEAKLHADEERLRILAEVTSDAIWERDLATDAVTWSPGLGALFGFVEEADRPHRWWRDHIHPAERDEVEASIEAAFASTANYWTAEYRFRRADGRYANVLDRGYIVRDAAGRPIRFIGAMVDITAPLQVAEAATRATLAERQRLARDLHDSVTQILYSASLMAETARRHVVAHDHEQSVEYIARLGGLTRQSLQQMRMLVHELEPAGSPDRTALLRAPRHWQEDTKPARVR
jgi:PAS domain S-box-containing protein